MLIAAGASYGQTFQCATKALSCDGSNDLTVLRVYLADADGNEFASNQEFECAEGDPVPNVWLWAEFGGSTSAGNRHSLRIYYEVYYNDMYANISEDLCFYNASGEFMPKLSDKKDYKLSPITWQCGDKVELKNLYLQWQTGEGARDGACTTCTGKCSFQNSIVVEAPLFPKFTISTPACVPGNDYQSVTYTSTTTGGKMPYTAYLWNLGATSDYTVVSGSTTASVVEVKYNSAGSKYVSLTVTEGNGITKTSDTETVTIAACFRVTAHAQAGNFECSNTTGINAWLTSAGGATTAGGCAPVVWSYAPYTLTGGATSYTGSATVTFTATDNCGEKVTTSAVLTISDTTPPVISGNPGPLTLECEWWENDDLLEEWLDSVTATDNCDNDVMVTYSPTTFDLSCDNVGDITVIWTATDDSGNKSTTSAVLTIEDTTAPNFGPVADGEAECDGEGNTEEYETWLTQFDPVDQPEATLDLDVDTEYLCGLTKVITVVATLTDQNSNSSTAEAVFTIKDTKAPSITAPDDIDIESDENCEWDADPDITGYAEVSDDCSDPEELEANIDYSDAVEDLGKGVYKITRTWTVTDECGNEASDVQIINVTGGNAPPEIVLNPIDVYLTQEGQWTLNRRNILDLTAGSMPGCGVDDELFFTVNRRYFDCNDVFGPVELWVTAEDSRGNSATAGPVFINVHDTIPPVAVCNDTTIWLDSFGQAKIVPGVVNQGGDRESVPEWARHHNDLEGGSYDACGISSMDLSQMIFTCADLGENLITLTVWDPSGNLATCEAVVTVLDIDPVLWQIDDIEITLEPGVCETAIDYPEIVATGNCTYELEHVEGLGADGHFPLGTTTETWKITDAGGHETLISFDVTVSTYNLPPTIAGVADIEVDEDTEVLEIALSNITPNIDCGDQQVVSVTATSDNPDTD
jgi:hypothetical protein